MFTFKYFKIPRTLSRDYCDKALQALEKVIKKPQQGIIHLIVIPGEEMARMNEQFRGKTGPTDILTFSYWKEKKKKGKGKTNDFFYSESQNFVVGEIYLCLEKIKLYAIERGYSYKEELEYIIIHGLVHLMGYDHEDEQEAIIMEEIEHKMQSIL
jgi:probable rRNA maturation factor